MGEKWKTSTATQWKVKLKALEAFCKTKYFQFITLIVSQQLFDDLFKSFHDICLPLEKETTQAAIIYESVYSCSEKFQTNTFVNFIHLIWISKKKISSYFPCKTPEVDSAYHLFFFWKSFEVELLLLLYRIYSTEGQKKMMVKFHKVNWTNWKALWTFLIECIKNFHPKNLNANFELREAIYSQKYSP